MIPNEFEELQVLMRAEVVAKVRLLERPERHLFDVPFEASTAEARELFRVLSMSQEFVDHETLSTLVRFGNLDYTSNEARQIVERVVALRANLSALVRELVADLERKRGEKQ